MLCVSWAINPTTLLAVFKVNLPLIGLTFSSKNVCYMFYAELIDKLTRNSSKKGYKTIICNSEHDSEKERE